MRYFELFESVLSEHNKIALDFDGTLISGPRAQDVQNFVLNNPEKSFFIITHRTRQETAKIPMELRQFTNLSPQNFKRIVACPDRLDFEFRHDIDERRRAGLPPLSTVQPRDMTPAEYRYVNWKGYVAKSLGATLLIDDIRWLTEPGCHLYKVEFMDVVAFPTVKQRVMA